MTVTTTVKAEEKKKSKKKIGSSPVNSKHLKETEYVLPLWTPERKKNLIAHISKVVAKAHGGVVQLIVDLFCGAGGTSEGFEKAEYQGVKNAVIVVGINHDKKAIYGQYVNHPLAYYTDEDIRLANLIPVLELLNELRELFPQCPIIIWASIECTNHSNAKGGLSRDADSRTLAWDLDRYVKELNPDGIWIENVKEFKLWGPLIEQVKWINKKGKKVKDTYPPTNEAGVMQYWWDKIERGEIGSCPLDIKKEKKKIIDYGPTWVTDKRYAGTFYNAWLNEIDAMGYHHQERILNAADFGVPQNRHRLFILFMRKGWPIAWPEPTHSKTGDNSFFPKKKHVPVKTCLDFSVEGRSVFVPGHVRKKKSWKRVNEGLVKFVAGGKEAFAKHKAENQLVKITPDQVVFDKIIEQVNTDKKNWIIKYMGNNEKTGVTAGNSIDNPANTIDCGARLNLAEACFITKTHGDGGGQLRSVSDTAGTVATKDQMAFVTAKQLPENFIYIYQGQSIGSTIENPSNTITADSEKFALIGLKYFISRSYRSGSTATSVDKPVGAIPTVPKTDLVTVQGWVGGDDYDNAGSSLDKPSKVVTSSRHHHYLYNPSWFGVSSGDIENPSMSIIARQDKAPLYLVSVERGEVKIMVPVFETDTPEMIEVKEFMALYNIYDIKKRMLMIPELLKIQDFPEDYKLFGTKTDKKKQIGNAVPPKVSQRISEANHHTLVDFILKYKKAA